MRRKKNEVTIGEANDQGVTLTPKHGGAPTKAQIALATPSIPVAQADGDDGLIDMDPVHAQFTKPTASIEDGPSPFVRTECTVVEYRTPEHVGETVVLAEGQKAKRKYTKRKKANSGANATPSFANPAAIREARIQGFVDYVNGKQTFNEASEQDDKFRKLQELVDELFGAKQ